MQCSCVVVDFFSFFIGLFDDRTLPVCSFGPDVQSLCVVYWLFTGSLLWELMMMMLMIMMMMMASSPCF